MDRSSFYQGVLHELNKIALEEQEKKPNLLSRIATNPLTYVGLGGLGYGAYKWFGGKGQAPTTADTTSTSPSPSIMDTVISQGKKEPMINQEPGSPIQNAVDLGWKADLYGYPATLGLRGVNTLSKGKLFDSAVGKVLKPIVNFPIKPLIPKTNLTPIGALAGVQNAVNAVQDYSSPAGKTLGAGAAMTLPFLPSGGPLSLAVGFNRIPLEIAGASQERSADNTARFADMLEPIYRGLHSGNSNEVAQARAAGKALLNSPALSKNLEEHLHPGLWDNAAQHNFYLTDKDSALPPWGSIPMLLRLIRNGSIMPKTDPQETGMLENYVKNIRGELR